jgi:hypothetical protein
MGFFVRFGGITMNSSTPEFKVRVAEDLALFAEYDAGERGDIAEVLCSLARQTGVLSQEFKEALFWEMAKIVEDYQSYCRIEKLPDGNTELVIFGKH